MTLPRRAPAISVSRTRTGAVARRAVRRVRVIRSTAKLLRYTALPGVATLGVVFLRRSIEIGALFDVRTAASLGLLTLGYAVLRLTWRRLDREADDLERAAL